MGDGKGERERERDNREKERERESRERGRVRGRRGGRVRESEERAADVVRRAMRQQPQPPRAHYAPAARKVAKVRYIDLVTEVHWLIYPSANSQECHGENLHRGALVVEIDRIALRNFLFFF